jgi:hypothetical protein
VIKSWHYEEKSQFCLQGVKDLFTLNFIKYVYSNNSNIKIGIYITAVMDSIATRSYSSCEHILNKDVW